MERRIAKKLKTEIAGLIRKELRTKEENLKVKMYMQMKEVEKKITG